MRLTEKSTFLNSHFLLLQGFLIFDKEEENMILGEKINIRA